MAQSKNKSFCCVPQCTNSRQKQPYLHFHEFPSNEDQKRQWVRAIKRDEGSSFHIRKGSTLVCSQHFKAADYNDGSARLKIGAVPSRFNWNNHTTINTKTCVYERVSARQAAETPHMSTQADGQGTREHDYSTHPPTGKPGCHNRTSDGVKFYRIPAGSHPFQQNRRRLWLQAIKRVDLDEHSSRDARVCSAHFITGEASFDSSNPDFVPSVFVYTKQSQSSDAKLDSTQNWKSDTICQSQLVETEIPADEEEENEEDDDDDDDVDDEDEYDDDDDDDEEEDDDEDSDCNEAPLQRDEVEREWLGRLQANLKNHMEKKPVSPKKATTTPRSEVTIGRLTKRFMDMLCSSPEGILDLNEATEKLGTRLRRRVYDITNVLSGIKVITKKSKSKIQWVGPIPISCFKGQWKNKMKTDLLNLKTMEESLDWLIKDCAQQLFALTDHTENAKSAYVTYEDICRIAAFQDQTVIAIKAPEETKLEVPTPTEECIKIHLKGTRGPIHVLTCETSGSDTTTPTEQLKNGRFLTLEESRIETSPLLTDRPAISSAVRSA